MRLASRLSSRPTPTTARPDGVAVTPSGGWIVVADLPYDHGPVLEVARARPGR